MGAHRVPAYGSKSAPVCRGSVRRINVEGPVVSISFGEKMAGGKNCGKLGVSSMGNAGEVMYQYCL